MNRVFTELSPRRDEIAQLYAVGQEKKEIASHLFRSTATVNTTLQNVFSSLHVRNRSELTIKFAERLSGYDLRRGVISACLLALFVFDMATEHSDFMRRRVEERAEHCETRHEEDLVPHFV